MKKQLIPFLLVASVVTVACSLLIGPSNHITVRDLLSAVSPHQIPGNGEEVIGTVLFDIRLPRILLAFLIGMALSVSGASLQAIFRNPLVDPFVLGISSGAATGAAFALATRLLPVQPAAFIGAALAVSLSSSLAGIRSTTSTVALILAGVVVSGIFTALLTLIQFFSDPFRLQTIVHWTMGSLQTASWDDVGAAGGPVVLGAGFLIVHRWRLNLLSLGDDEITSAGLRPGRQRLLVLGAATLATAAGVAVAGIIGFYGLFIPHIVRMVLGADNRRLLPASALFGGTFLVLIDDLARSLTSFEIPIGVFTIMLGAPFFLLLLRTSRIGWQE